MPQVLTSEHGVKHKLMPRWLVPFFPKKFVAITLSKSLCYYRTEAHLEDEPLRVHESVHAGQFREYGWVKFIFLYCWEHLRHGYAGNKFERQARSVAGR
jgi:hypothetical protein